MKRISTLVIVLALVGLSFSLVNGCKKKAVAVEAGKIASAEPTSFKEVTSKLDPGGDLYLYLSTEQWLQNLSGKVSKWHELAAALPDLKDRRDVVDNTFNIVTHLIKDSGL